MFNGKDRQHHYIRDMRKKSMKFCESSRYIFVNYCQRDGKEVMSDTSLKNQNSLEKPPSVIESYQLNVNKTHSS